MVWYILFHAVPHFNVHVSNQNYACSKSIWEDVGEDQKGRCISSSLYHAVNFHFHSQICKYFHIFLADLVNLQQIADCILEWHHWCTTWKTFHVNIYGIHVMLQIITIHSGFQLRHWIAYHLGSELHHIWDGISKICEFGMANLAQLYHLLICIWQLEVFTWNRASKQPISTHRLVTIIDARKKSIKKAKKIAVHHCYFINKKCMHSRCVDEVDVFVQSHRAPNRCWKVVPFLIKVAAFPDNAVAMAILSSILAKASRTLHTNVFPLPPGASIV